MVDCQYVINRNARAGMPPGYAIAKLQIVANNQDEVRQMMTAMQQWANGTFEPVVMERQDPDGPLIVSSVEEKEPEIEELDIDPITGEIR
jgi:hypothetical protein